MNQAKDLDRALKAKAVLDNPLYTESFDLVRSAIIERIEKCSLKDVETAEDLRKCLKLLRDVRANLNQAISAGKVVQFKLAEDEARRANPLRRLFR